MLRRMRSKVRDSLVVNQHQDEDQQTRCALQHLHPNSYNEVMQPSLGVDGGRHPSEEQRYLQEFTGCLKNAGRNHILPQHGEKNTNVE